MTTRIEAPGAEPLAVAEERSIELALARVHLRLGSLALARTELELLARRGQLDRDGYVDLAEVRWRSGDLTSAGAAAAVALDDGDDTAVALAIAAEAAAALGRPNEARRLANKALERVEGPIDPLFAGMPRSAVWPTDASEPAPTAGTLFHRETGAPPNRRAGDVDPDVVAARSAGPADGADPATGSPLTLGFWDADRGGPSATAELPDPASELEAGRAARRGGSEDEATLRFALALRLAPALAPAILEATEGMAVPAIHVVRGDAYRLVGLETEATRAYAAAAWSGARDRRSRTDGTERRTGAAKRPGSSAPAGEPGPETEPQPATADEGPNGASEPAER